MIKSMTGFGRCEIAEADRKFTVEMKGVNHRYLDVNIRMPKKLNFFESAIRNLLKQYVQRGKIDIFIGYEDMTESQMTLKYNQKLAEEYMASFKQMEEQFGLDNDVRVSTLARCPEVLTMEEQSVDEEELWSGLEKAMKGACEQFVQTKTTEGENLKKDIIGKLDGMLEVVARVEERSPQIVAEYREKLETKVKELLGDTQIDEGRIAAEVVIFSDKICTDEEVVRLKSHIKHMKETLEQTEGIGRKLDFIAQEMNRGLDNDVRVSTLARCPEVLTMEEQSVDEEELWSGLEKAMKGACEQFVQTKTTEGENLKKDIIGKLDGMLEVVARVEERSPQIVAEYREKLETKVKELLGDTQIDEGRIAAEVVIFSDKICTDEEVVRLKSHIKHMKETLEQTEGIGRKLDFIAQEMNREANTILSKANDLEVSNYALSLIHI